MKSPKEGFTANLNLVAVQYRCSSSPFFSSRILVLQYELSYLFALFGQSRLASIST